MTSSIGGIGDGLDMSLTDLIANARGMTGSGLARYRQIQILLKELEATWHHYPDKTLGQLMATLAERPCEPCAAAGIQPNAWSRVHTSHLERLSDDGWIQLLRATWTHP